MTHSNSKSKKRNKSTVEPRQTKDSFYDEDQSTLELEEINFLTALAFIDFFWVSPLRTTVKEKVIAKIWKNDLSKQVETQINMYSTLYNAQPIIITSNNNPFPRIKITTNTDIWSVVLLVCDKTCVHVLGNDFVENNEIEINHHVEKNQKSRKTQLFSVDFKDLKFKQTSGDDVWGIKVLLLSKDGQKVAERDIKHSIYTVSHVNQLRELQIQKVFPGYGYVGIPFQLSVLGRFYNSSHLKLSFNGQIKNCSILADLNVLVMEDIIEPTAGYKEVFIWDSRTQKRSLSSIFEVRSISSISIKDYMIGDSNYAGEGHLNQGIIVPLSLNGANVDLNHV